MTVLELLAIISLVMLTLGALGAVYRIARGPSTLDRAIATDVLLITISTGLCILMALMETDAFMMFVVVASMIGFLGSVTLARFTVDGAQARTAEQYYEMARKRAQAREQQAPQSVEASSGNTATTVSGSEMRDEINKGENS